MNLTNRTKLRRLPDRGSYDRETICRVLDAGFLAHVGFSIDAQPFVIPTLYGRRGERLYLHGSAASRMLRQLGTGIPACISELDQSIYARQGRVRRCSVTSGLIAKY